MKIGKVEKLVANLQDETEYVIDIRNLKQALNHGLVLKKVQSDQNAWLNPYINMNLDLPEPNYRTTKFFTESLLAIETRKTQILMNKPVYLGLSKLDLSKILIYEF